MTATNEILSKTILLEIPPEITGHGRQGRPRSGSRGRVRSPSPAAVAIAAADIKVLFENVYDAALITDIAGVILDANPRASHAFELSHEEFCMRNIANIILGFDDKVMKMVCDNLTNDRFTLIQASCQRKDNSEFPAEVSTSRMRLPGCDLLCFFIRDVTARREAEEQIQRAHDELAAEVQERTKLNEELNAEIAVRKTAEEKLRQAIVKLQEHDRAKSEFVSNVSHELKTPLTSIKYIAGNLQKGIAGPLGPQAQDYLDMIRADCQRLARTVEDILDMSRIEAKALKLRCVKIHFPRFVSNTVESLRIQIEAAGLRLSVAMDDAHPFVNGDPQKIERVIFNIIRNAIKFNVPQGTVEVRLKDDPRTPGYLLLEVIDSGIGIEAQHLKRVTERFFRIGEHVSGAGLGLAICKELMEHHGGTIDFQSPPPQRAQGTWVGMRFPVVTAPAVLVMCDEAEIRGRVKGQLMACGYEVLIAAMNVDLAGEVAARKPDLIVLGWTAPGLEATRIISTLRSSEQLRAIPMMIIAGGEGNAVKQEILRGVGAPILTAPWQDGDLFRRLDQVAVGKKGMTS